MTTGIRQAATIFNTGALTRTELKEMGRSLREQVTLREHGIWKPASNRVDPVEILQSQDAVRLQELVPVRYGRMLASPFAFFRGASAVMATDLAGTPITNVNVQACCDAHVDNFGIYASAERQIVFDLNDFDETLPAPWEYDVKRFAASIALDARQLGYSDQQAEDVIRKCIVEYGNVLDNLSKVASLDIHYARLDESLYLAMTEDEDVLKYARKIISKARKRSSKQVMKKWCTRVGGKLRFVDIPPTQSRLNDEQVEHFRDLYNRYRATLPQDRQHALKEYRFRDAARRVVGIGSVGLDSHIVLLEGRGDPDPLVLQFKEATTSVMTPYAGKSGYARHGERVVAGQKLMQATSDPFLGWVPFGKKDLYVRQLRDMKGPSGGSPIFPLYEVDCVVCAGALARAHARSVDPSLIHGYVGHGRRFAASLSRFAMSYADQAEEDYNALIDAVKSGKLTAAAGI